MAAHESDSNTIFLNLHRWLVSCLWTMHVASTLPSKAVLYFPKGVWKENSFEKTLALILTQERQ